MYWLLFYDYVDEIVDRRGPYREQHLALAQAAHQAGVLLMAGALLEPLDGAVFVFKADDDAVVEDFVRNDPYVQAGLVTASQIRPWKVVVGDEGSQ